MRAHQIFYAAHKRLSPFLILLSRSHPPATQSAAHGPHRPGVLVSHSKGVSVRSPGERRYSTRLKICGELVSASSESKLTQVGGMFQVHGVGVTRGLRIRRGRHHLNGPAECKLN